MFLYLQEEMEDIIYFTQIQLSIYMFFHMIKAINSLKNLIQDIKVILLTLLQLIMSYNVGGSSTREANRERAKIIEAWGKRKCQLFI